MLLIPYKKSKIPDQNVYMISINIFFWQHPAIVPQNNDCLAAGYLNSSIRMCRPHPDLVAGPSHTFRDTCLTQPGKHYHKMLQSPCLPMTGLTKECLTTQPMALPFWKRINYSS